ncbi:MAG TPA: hypothetical protein VFI73_01300 [Candidatus Nitrosopolaris sp.]|nr:hypothetical protein [Candidatus Nitrosopolaris sp.]
MGLHDQKQILETFGNAHKVIRSQQITTSQTYLRLLLDSPEESPISEAEKLENAFDYYLSVISLPIKPLTITNRICS